MKTHIFRLKPGQELRSAIQKYASKHEISAGYIITCVAGLKQVTLRMAGAEPKHQDVRTYHEKFEVVSLVGTVYKDDCHLHIAVSDKEGKVIGGHLKEAIIEPTAEVVIGESEEHIMSREMDETTGFEELVISQR